MEHVVLGSGGDPQLNTERTAPATAIVHEGGIHVVDCGNGVARQLTRAGVDLRDLATLGSTHHHSEHAALQAA
ncbi:MBL fold metallo-hydrolase [Haloechinothrix sp. YIM 98757]|uniref:MBL fold metallo-hydrolase n=1 Tax=Haloechinothrix aidingensis TaxID=2752311 RepID=A0A837ZUJ3_9PSEU|nr:MBL fold metallo-hydrolase [Haloechinothrix aidingensis]MBA0124266.1 MBL fold metallo-hydrolase [Haloechinothrix aidingensis]